MRPKVSRLMLDDTELGKPNQNNLQETIPLETLENAKSFTFELPT